MLHPWWAGGVGRGHGSPQLPPQFDSWPGLWRCRPCAAGSRQAAGWTRAATAVPSSCCLLCHPAAVPQAALLLLQVVGMARDKPEGEAEGVGLQAAAPTTAATSAREGSSLVV